MCFRFRTYNKFKEEKWEELSPEERLETFQKLENIQAKKLGRPAYTISPNYSWSELVNGECSSRYKIIQINQRFLYEPELRFLGMMTIFHEGRHAFQYESCFGESEPSRFSRAYKWKRNFEGYINGMTDKYSFYSMQPVELDANKYAINRMLDFAHRYRYEPLYHRTLTFKENAMENAKDVARKELGIFYKWKVARRTKRERKKNHYD